MNKIILVILLAQKFWAVKIIAAHKTDIYDLNLNAKGAQKYFFSKLQGTKGIRQWLINLRTSPMLIHKIILSVD